MSLLVKHVMYITGGVSEPMMGYSSASTFGLYNPCILLKVLPWVDVCAGGLGAGKTGGAGTRGVSLNAAIGGRTGYSDTNGGESSNN